MRMCLLWMISLIGCVPRVDPGPAVAVEITRPVHLLQVPDPSSPNIYLQAMVAAGSAYDPIGQEGLAHLTARAMVAGGAGDLPPSALREALFPTGNEEIELIVDKEWVSVRLTCHRDHAALCADLFSQVLTAPLFDPQTTTRLRDAALYDVDEGLLADEEALGHVALDSWLNEGDRTGHPVQGRAGVLPLLDVDDVRAFWERHYVRRAVLVGLAGYVEPELFDAMQERLKELPGRRPPELVLSAPTPVQGRSLLVLDTLTPVTGFHFGHPLAVTRDHADWPALYLASQVLGIHRSSSGRLYQRMRTARGLNYGDYAYIEPFVQRGWGRLQEQGTVRSHPSFSVWIRPVSIDNGPFALKFALDEVEQWVAEGLTEREFEDMRKFLIAHLPLEAKDPGRRLAYTLEATASGLPDPLKTLADRLAALTLEDVNAAIKRHIRPDDLQIVAVSGEADALRQQLIEQAVTPIVYADTTPDDKQAKRDAEIAASGIDVPAQRARVVPAQGFFR